MGWYTLLMTNRNARRDELDNCDLCDRRTELFHHEATGDSLCARCYDAANEIAARPVSTPTGRKNTSHANCNHESTPKARANCRKARAEKAERKALSVRNA